MSTKYILVGGYLDKGLDSGKAFCEELIKGINKKPIKILICMFARSRDSWEEKFNEDTLFFSENIKDFELALATPEFFLNQIKESDVIFIRGGYTSLLINILNGIPGWDKELEGKTLAGTSAGADIISKYYYVIDTPRLGDGLGLLPVKVIVHWKSDYKDFENKNINWDKIYNELKNYKEDLPIYTLKEGEFIVIES